MPIDFKIRAYDPARDEATVSRQVARHGYRWPYAHPGAHESNAAAGWLVDVVLNGVKTGRGAVAYLEGEEESRLSLALVTGRGEIAWAHTQFPFRQMGLGTSLCNFLGLDFAKPVGVLVWTPAASRIAARGYRIYPVPFEPNGKKSENEERSRDVRGGH